MLLFLPDTEVVKILAAADPSASGINSGDEEDVQFKDIDLLSVNLKYLVLSLCQSI
ncbi:hypothetical protein P3L10_030971 [Capsicum annuum]